jgi:hypothetical protein
MKSILLVDHYAEVDVKPTDMLETYIRLTSENVGQMIARTNLNECICPGCGDDTNPEAFQRFGLTYVACPNCRTLRVSPRPDESAIADYYANSEAEVYWRDELSSSTADARMERIVVPRFDWIIDSTQQYLPDAAHIVDLGTHQQTYVQALAGMNRFSRKTVLNPICPIDPGSLASDISVVHGDPDEVLAAGSVDALALFEVLDRTADVDGLMEAAQRMLRPSGLAFVTGILSTGFDIQTLWEKASNIFPPDRLNVFSVEGLTQLLEKHGFEVLEFSTPGMFDFATVAHALETDPNVAVPRFVSYMIENRGAEGRQRFQEFLQMNLLSSYGRVLIQRR